MIEKNWVALDKKRHELIELTSVISLVLGDLVDSKQGNNDYAEIAVNGLFVTLREIERITGELGIIATNWRESEGNM